MLEKNEVPSLCQIFFDIRASSPYTPSSKIPITYHSGRFGGIDRRKKPAGILNMKMKDLSLRAKIVTAGILMVLIPLVIVGTVTFIYSSRTLEAISKRQMEQIAKSVSEMLRLSLEKELKILEATARDPLVVRAASTGKFRILDEKMADLYGKIGTDYEGIAFFDAKGVISSDGADKSRVGISIADRQYFQSAREGRTNVIGTPTQSKATGRPIFVLCAPVLSKEGRFLGGILGIVKADYLNKHIASLRLGETGYAFMVDSQGLLIAHPNASLILRTDGTKAGGIRELSERMTSQQTGTAEYTFQGMQKVAGFAPVKLTGWSVCVTQEKNEVMSLAYTNRNFILMVSFIFLLLTIPAVFFLSRTISNPVQKTLNALNQAIWQAAEPIFIIGLDRQVRFVNPALASLIDQPVRNLVGKGPYLGDPRDTDGEEIWKKLEGGRRWTGSITGKKRDGSPFSMNLAITPVRSKTGKISSYLAIGRDITRELMMEAQLRQSQKMEAIGTLAGGIAHDFNNILSAMMGYAELVELKTTDQQIRPYLEQILKACRRSRDLITQILTFSRQREQEKKILAVTPIVKEALKLLRSSLPSTVEIRQEYNARKDTVLADPTRIHQVLMNLCTNAVHAMRGKGGILEVGLSERTISADQPDWNTTLREGAYLQLWVKDTGEGIDPAIRDKIFDPFFTTKPSGEGTGLGLSVVYGIVKDHGGAIAVESEPGKGTVFTICLPLIEIKGEPEGREAVPVPRGEGHILYVDDEAAIAAMSEEMLTSLGYEVTVCLGSPDALETFRADPGRFDAVITDMTMPNMTGAALAAELLKIRPGLPIILTTGFSELINDREAKRIGIREFLMKPVSLSDLAQTVKRILDAEAMRPASSNASIRSGS